MYQQILSKHSHNTESREKHQRFQEQKLNSESKVCMDKAKPRDVPEPIKEPKFRFDIKPPIAISLRR